MKPMLQRALLIATLFATQALAADMAHNAGTNAALSPVIAPESRQLLEMPAAAKNTMRFEMLERLKALQVVMQALAEGKPQEAAEISKATIGTGVMMRHSKRAPEAIPRNYMPESMQALSKQAHMQGDELAEALKSADRARIDAQLSKTIGNCVSCHNLYRIN